MKISQGHRQNFVRAAAPEVSKYKGKFEIKVPISYTIGSMERILRDDIPDGGCFVLVREEGHPSLGHGIAIVEENILLLESIQVLKRHRGRGIGRQILDALVEWGMEQGATELRGDFTPDTGEEEVARVFYERMSIQITPERKLLKKLSQNTQI